MKFILSVDLLRLRLSSVSFLNNLNFIRFSKSGLYFKMVIGRQQKKLDKSLISTVWAPKFMLKTTARKKASRGWQPKKSAIFRDESSVDWKTESVKPDFLALKVMNSMCSRIESGLEIGGLGLFMPRIYSWLGREKNWENIVWRLSYSIWDRFASKKINR